MVYEPDLRPSPRRGVPDVVEGRGQVLDLDGEASRVMVRLGDAEVEAKVERRRLWLNVRTTTMMLKIYDDIENTLTVDCPDVRYAVHRGPKRDWTAARVGPAE